MERTFHLVSLGCAKNRVDSEQMLAHMCMSGYVPVPSADGADVVVINTCGFIGPAKREAIDLIVEMVELKRQGRISKIAVAGCLAQRYPEELLAEIPEVDVLLGVFDSHKLVASLESAFGGERVLEVSDPETGTPVSRARMLTSEPGTAYLRISEGCDNRCSYCVIPSLRGRRRSIPPDTLVQEARMLADLGVLELVLIAQDTTDYGGDIGTDLVSLLKALDRIDGLRWIRLLYAHPARVSQSLIRQMAESDKACPYIDIPMQHASESVLRRMGRPGNADDYLRLIDNLRSEINGVSIRSTFMIGFPGETPGDLEALISFLTRAELDYAGFFAYSKEEGTRAFNFPDQVPYSEKRRRLSVVRSVQTGITLKKLNGRLGSRQDVLCGSSKDGKSRCRAVFQAPEVDGCVFVNAPLSPGKMYEAVLYKTRRLDLLGKVENR
ncbi:MAG: 30S ribosomal protein S12 methylthiotransferase RimO [Bacillota bacterium]